MVAHGFEVPAKALGSDVDAEHRLRRGAAVTPGAPREGALMSRSQRGKQRVPVAGLVGLQPDATVRIRRYAIENRQKRPRVVPGHRPDLRRRERQELRETEQPPCIAAKRNPRIAFRVFPDQEKDAAESDQGVVRPWSSLHGRTMPAG